MDPVALALLLVLLAGALGLVLAVAGFVPRYRRWFEP